MVAIDAPFGILPILAYTLASLLLIYVGLRLVRFFKARQSSALPKPVSGPTSKSVSLLGGARSTASSWRQWSQSLPLPPFPQVRVPWVRIPSLSESTIETSVVPVKAKNSKSLAIELLPTTGLPPPPSSAPIFSPTPTRAATPALHPHPPLIDVGSPPATPALTASSTAASGGSFPGSPRTPSPLHGRKAIYIPHASYSRSPSPRALLSTTPPTKHKRSRSLGGVPVRRLSNGAGSSLRNAVEVDGGDVELGVLGKRTKGNEQLLIDFSPSSSGSGEASDDDPYVSPAASDIGMLSLTRSGAPPSSKAYTTYASTGPYAHSGYKVAPAIISAAAPVAALLLDARQVGRHVPLVDFSQSYDKNARAVSTTSNFDDDGWKWFGAGVGTGIGLARTPIHSPKAHVLLKEKEKLVDIDDDVSQVSELVSVPIVPVKDIGRSKETPLVELDAADDREGVLVDVGFGDEDEEHWARQSYSSQIPVSDEKKSKYATENDIVHYDELTHDAEETADLERSNYSVSTRSSSPQVEAGFQPSTYTPPSEPQLVDFVTTSVPAAGSAESWNWNDPWTGHIASHSVDADSVDLSSNEHLVELEEHPIVVEREEEETKPSDHQVIDVQQPIEDDEPVVERSPAGLLKATVLDEDDEDERVPDLDLESLELEAFVPFAALDAGEAAHISTQHDVQALDDEEITPTPTPASTHAELPLTDITETVLDDAEAQTVLEASTEGFYPDPELEDAWLPSVDNAPRESDVVVVVKQQDELFPDPDLLPLPEASVAETTTETETESTEDTLDVLRSQLIAIADKARPRTPALSQTPTPPASPPPLYPISTVPTLLRPGKSRGASRMPSPTATVNSTAAFPLVSSAQDEDKENAAVTPTTQLRPAWSLRASDAPALGLPSSGSPIGASPRGKRKALEDVNWGPVEAEKQVMLEVQKEETVIVAEEVKIQEPDLEAVRDVDVHKEVVQQEVHDDKKAELSVFDVVAPPIKPSTSLPGAFPEPPTIVVSPPATTSGVSFPSSEETISTSTYPSTSTSSTVTQRIRSASFTARTAWLPSARNIVNSPLDIALAMQMRPGLGAGADPAWMVRFLMAVYGWLLVSVAGGDF